MQTLVKTRQVHLTFNEDCFNTFKVNVYNYNLQEYFKSLGSRDAFLYGPLIKLRKSAQRVHT